MNTALCLTGTGRSIEHTFMDKVKQYRFDKNANLIHQNCIYVGNHKDVNKDIIHILCNELNNIQE